MDCKTSLTYYAMITDEIEQMGDMETLLVELQEKDEYIPIKNWYNKILDNYGDKHHEEQNIPDESKVNIYSCCEVKFDDLSVLSNTVDEERASNLISRIENIFKTHGAMYALDVFIKKSFNQEEINSVITEMSA